MIEIIELMLSKDKITDSGRRFLISLLGCYKKIEIINNKKN